ncbi:MAG TPA: hypothetical protein VEZ70_05255 [Allosphingosinicella sp.]|nr:hypothetical protein [Allosphingosinicella sp.]
MTGFTFGGAMRSAEHFLRRHLKSKSVREAEKRRQERRQRETNRKFKRAAALGGVTGTGAFAFALTLAPLTSALLAAGAVAVAGAALTGFLPGRRPPAQFSREELQALPCQAEEWLLDQRMMLPPTAWPVYEHILDLLGDLPRHLGGIEPASTVAWEARRLIGEHLPTLIATWCGLPTSVRERPEEVHRLVEGMTTISVELGRLAEEASRDERFQFETRQRFLDMRYRDGLSNS